MINLEIKSEDICVELEIKEYIGCFGSGNIAAYDGEYKVTPSTREQILETKGKRMKEDVTVNKIPSYEVSNETGTTFIIGGTL